MELNKLLILVHVFAMLSWLGAMYFNLTLLFPMYRSRPAGDCAQLMQEQGNRAAPLLYVLIFTTVLSGLALLWVQPEALHSKAIGLKFACWAVMLGCHLYGSYSVWPRVFLALDEEKEQLFFIYKISMFISATAGTIAVMLAYLNI